jgi:hypothetical protein
MRRLGPAWRARLPLLLGLAALYVAWLWIVGFGLLADSPRALALGLTLDLTGTATLAVWWFGVRRGELPQIALPITFGIGFCAAVLLLPDARAMHMRALAYGWVLVELGLLAALLVRVGRVVQTTRAELLMGRGMPDALECGVSTVLAAHPVIARLLANELSVLFYALLGWFRRPLPALAGERVSAHEGLGQWRAILCAVVLLLASESLVSHVLLALWSPIAAWVATGTALYGLIWLLGDYQLLRLNPLRLTASELHAEFGLRGRAVIPVAAVASIRAFEPDGLPTGLGLCVFGAPDTVLELHRELSVVRGLRREQTSSLGLRMGPLARELGERLRADAGSES